ncbi:MAG: sodium-dependent transporter, partial [Pseudomonadota bacterium]
AMRHAAVRANRSPWWAGVGYLNLLTAFAILIAYTVVAGWVLYYLYLALVGDFSSIDAGGANRQFARLLADVPTLSGWTLVALGAACLIIYAGVQRGIERAVSVLMPTLFVLLVGLAIFNVFAGGMAQTLDYLFTPDFSKLSADVFLAAVGQAFFSIGVAMAGMMMFGAYLPRHVSILHSAVIIVLADTAVALLAGLVIFPMVFNNGLDPAGGTGLIFQTLPVAFAQMPGGLFVAVLFFLLLSVAAITSVVGLCEPLVAWLGERFGLNRHRAVLVLVGLVMLASFCSVLSYNVWQNLSVFGLTLATLLDWVPNQILLPLGGLFIALFVGWVALPEHNRDALNLSHQHFSLWQGLVRFVVVPAVLIIFVTGVWS